MDEVMTHADQRPNDWLNNEADKDYNRWQFNLSFEQQAMIRGDSRPGDLMQFAQKVYGKPVSRNSEEFKNMQRFLHKVRRDTGIFNFTQEEMDFIQNNAAYMSVIEMTRHLFPNVKLPQGISSSVGMMCERWGITPQRGTGKDETGNIADEEYVPINNHRTLIWRINDLDPGCGLDAKSQTKFQRDCLDALKKNLRSVRFVLLANQIDKKNLRQLFEDEFIKATWNKPELDPDDINGYISLSYEYVNEFVLDAQLRKINEDLYENRDKEDRYNKPQVDAANNKNQELKECRARMDKLREKLSGSREAKVKARQASGDSLGRFFVAVQEEQNREQFKRVEEARNLVLKEEIQRVSDYEDLIAYVAGIDEKELIPF